ncbi:hypothetical protein [Kutzneria chonburiensis]|uniref:Uncharacterized protein n=1 Tax=Kutzneria chonburiensis TaxID=1483604 RepID=A0ABV6MZH1_9PSEU|nr:hypothetical protein [Kutzneria chonburiensis]
MSIEPISWALNSAPIPRDRHDAFPAVSTLVRYTRLSERSVQYALRSLEVLDLICPSDPDIVAAYVKRVDRRPKGWDLAIHSGVQSVRPADLDGVQTQRHGVQTTTSQDAMVAPDPSPSDQNVPRDLAAVTSNRECFAIGDKTRNNFVLGDKAHENGISALGLKPKTRAR